MSEKIYIILLILFLVFFCALTYAEDCRIHKLIDELPWICQYAKPPCSKGLEPVEGFNAKNIYQHLSYANWQERARAVSLIRNLETSPSKDEVNKDEVLKKLTDMGNNEAELLLIRYLAIDAYLHLKKE